MEDFTQQALRNEGRKLSTDRILIKAAEITAQALAIENVALATERLAEARLKNAQAMEREAKALRELEDAKVFAEIDAANRKPPQKVSRLQEAKAQ